MKKERDTMEWIAIVIIGVILGNLSTQVLFRLFPQWLSLIALVITIVILFIAIRLGLEK